MKREKPTYKELVAALKETVSFIEVLRPQQRWALTYFKGLITRAEART
jgi:hypothetical protein